MRARLYLATTVLFGPVLFGPVLFGMSGVACSSTSGEQPGDGGPDSTSTPDDAAAIDGASPAADGGGTDGATPEGGQSPDGSSDAAAYQDGGGDAGDDAAASPFVGAVFAVSDSTLTGDGGVQQDYSAGGYFVHVTSPDMSVTSSTVGPCLVQVYGSGASAVETKESAGTLQITGGKKALTISPDGTKTYQPVSASDSNLWNGGETLTVTAAGSDLPPFTTSLTAPSKITLTSPALPPSSGAISVPRNAPFSATWTGASSGVVVLYFDATDASNNAFALTCTFAASAGSGQVPAAALASFPAAGSGTFNFYVKATSAPSVPGWNIHFNATSTVVDGQGTGATGNATYP